MTDTQTAIQATIDRLEGLQTELGNHAEADSPHIPVFRYSDDLVEFMNSHDVTDPNAAYGEISDMIEELADERDALDS